MRVLAVDLGATSVRVVAVDLGAPEPDARVLHRWPHQPVRHSDGSLRWDWRGILREVERGLELGLAEGPVASIGVDGWGVDYGLLDGRGALLSPPYCYRDERTRDWRTTAERIGAGHLYDVTGIQLLGLNTIFQLAAHDRSERSRAARLLLLPDLVVRTLTGFEGAERSNASTTALLDARTGAWSVELLEAVGLDPALLPPIVPAGRAVGSWRGVAVHTVGSHDTASAFIGVPGVPGPGSVVVSSGTWVLVGAERPGADTSEKARDANFSNEAGALGGVRFLKNVTGFWLLERCRAAWGNPAVEELVAAAAGIRGPVRVVNPADARFLAPADMEAEIRAAAGLGTAASRAEVVRCILESIASATARIADELVAVTGTPVDELLVVGGGARIRLMNELLGRHAGVPVTVGSPEATALGNAVVQGLALGRFERLEDARRWLAIGAERLPL
ncbi:MAG TPA: FGGY-family carbohydrate kinase [Acidimicrobiales bacterium]